MPDRPIETDRQLVSDLQEYFAVTTGTDLPAGVRAMSAATLAAPVELRDCPGIESLRRWLLPAVSVATAATVLLVGYAALRGSVGNSTNSSTGATSYSAGAGSDGGIDTVTRPPAAGPSRPANTRISYPGADSGVLLSAGHTQLLAPSGRGNPVVSGVAAQAIAVASRSRNATTPPAAGPPELAVVDDRSSTPITCFCWVIAVQVTAPTAAAQGHAVLVYVDAIDGRVAGSHTGAGNP